MNTCPVCTVRFTEVPFFSCLEQWDCAQSWPHISSVISVLPEPLPCLLRAGVLLMASTLPWSNFKVQQDICWAVCVTLANYSYLLEWDLINPRFKSHKKPNELFWHLYYTGYSSAASNYFTRCTAPNWAMLDLLERYRNFKTSTSKSWTGSARAFSDKAAFHQKTVVCQKWEVVLKSPRGAVLCWNADGVPTSFCSMPNRPQGVDEQLGSSKPPNIAAPGQPHLQAVLAMGHTGFPYRPPRGGTTLLDRLCGSPESFGFWDSPVVMASIRNLPQLSAVKRSWKPGRLSWAWACQFLAGIQVDHMKFSRFYLRAEWEGKAFGRWEFLVRFHGLVDINMLNFALCSADDLP